MNKQKENSIQMDLFQEWANMNEAEKNTLIMGRNKQFCNDCPDYENGGLGCPECVVEKVEECA